MQIKDQMHRTVTLPSVPLRIVSLVPSQTELLIDLGLKDSLVGITKFCVHPENLRNEKTIVGGTKQVRFSKIEKLQPDIILCNKEENTKEMVLELEKIAPVWVSDIVTIEDCESMIISFGTLFHQEENAVHLVQALKNELNAFKVFIEGKPRFKTAYLIWKKPYMAAGPNTFIDHLLQLNNLENIFKNCTQRYPEMEAKFLEEAELILLSSEPYPFKDKHRRALQEKFPESKIIIVDGEYFSWYGSRLIKAFAYFKKLHTGLS